MVVEISPDRFIKLPVLKLVLGFTLNPSSGDIREIHRG